MKDPILEISYSFGQFQVYDSQEGQCKTAWTEAHCRQGFCRSPSGIDFATIDQWGRAQVHILRLPLQDLPRFDRVISVPLYLPSGIVVIKGPEERPNSMELEAGNYKVTVGQKLTDECREYIEISFEKKATPILQSEIPVQDEGLDPSLELIER